jgi:hypothetical protein
VDRKELTRLATEIAHYVIESGQVDDEDPEWWIPNLGAAVAFEADERGLENAAEIADEAVRLFPQKPERSALQ